MAADGIYVETGTVGVPTFNGLSEDRRSELRGPDGIGKMAAALKIEPALFTIHNAITLSALRAKWKGTGATDKPQDRKSAEYLDTLMDDMVIEFDKVMRFILSGVAFGYSDVHVVYKRRLGRTPKGALPESRHDDGYVGVRKMAIRRQETITEWKRDPAGDVTQMIQTNPETGLIYPPVDIDKLLHFSFGNDRGDWEGQGWLEPAYKPYRMIAELEMIYGIGQQRAHVGLPVFEYQTTKPDADVQARVKVIGQNLVVNQQQFVALPKDVVTMRLETIANTGGGELREQIKQLRWELTAMVLLTFLRLGNSETGSRSLADPLMDLFRSSIDSYNQTIAAVFNRHLIPRLMRANPALGEQVTDYPQFVPSSISDIPLQVMAFLGQISAFLSTAQAPDANWLRQSLGMELIEEGAEDKPIAPEITKPAPGEEDEEAEDGEKSEESAESAEKSADSKKGKPKKEDEEEDLSTARRWLNTINLGEAEQLSKVAGEYQAVRRSRHSYQTRK